MHAGCALLAHLLAVRWAGVCLHCRLHTTALVHSPTRNATQACRAAREAAEQEDAWMDRVERAPVFTPTEAEWEDPLTYIRSIQVRWQCPAPSYPQHQSYGKHERAAALAAQPIVAAPAVAACWDDFEQLSAGHGGGAYGAAAAPAQRQRRGRRNATGPAAARSLPTDVSLCLPAEPCCLQAEASRYGICIVRSPVAPTIPAGLVSLTAPACAACTALGPAGQASSRHRRHACRWMRRLMTAYVAATLGCATRLCGCSSAAAFCSAWRFRTRPLSSTHGSRRCGARPGRTFPGASPSSM